MGEPSVPKLAFLGPLGTYSHQSAYNRFGKNVEYVEKSTISGLFDAVSAEIPLAVVPQENSIFGIVTETYDSLRSPEIGQKKFVRGETTLAVQHCLVVRSGVQVENITKIMSHEQALGQCARFISKNFPNAILRKTPSTAAAAEALLVPPENPEEGESAAICSALCAEIFHGLSIARESIQDEDSNCTRFYVLSNTLEGNLPILPTDEPQLRRALVRLCLQPGETPAEASDLEHASMPNSIRSISHSRSLHLIIGTLLTSFGVPITRVDRRPSLSAVPFEDTYFIELEELGTPAIVQPGEDRSIADAAWIARVRMGIDRVEAAGCEGVLLGVW